MNRPANCTLSLSADVLENVTDGALVVDMHVEDYPIAWVSDSLLKLTEYSRDEVVGKNCRFLQGKNSDPATIKKMHEAVFSGKPFIGEIKNYKKSGEEFCNLVRMSPVYDKSNQLTHFIGSQTNITPYYESEQNIRKLQEKLTEQGMVNVASEMAIGISHELSQPLTATSNYIDGLISQLNADKNLDNIQSIITRCSSQLNRAKNILNDFRRYITAQSLNTRTCYFHKLIDEVITFLLPKLQKNNIQIETQYESNIKLNIDKIKIQQIISNIIINAIEAINATQTTNGKIKIQTHLADSNVFVAISDNGPGIPEEKIHNVFDQLFTTKKHGMGIGLSLSKNLAELHNGNLTVENLTDHGAKFTLTLPVT